MAKRVPAEQQLGEFLSRFNRMSANAAAEVIVSYSTSFTLATKLLGKRVRTDIRNFYAVVRIADEIVDGTARAAGLDKEETAQVLDEYECAVLAAPGRPFHTDPVLHAYADTARRCGFQDEHVRDFFAAMRRDLTQADHDADSFESYIYGSAEVIGLLCLQIFLADEPTPEPERARMEAGARSLGAAFQKINFLRDMAEDAHTLGRAYLPGAGKLCEADKAGLIRDIEKDLADARDTIPLLPASARTGVLAATDLFTELTRRLAGASVTELYRQRVSVPAPTKTKIVARAVIAARRMKGN